MIWKIWLIWMVWNLDIWMIWKIWKVIWKTHLPCDLDDLAPPLSE